MAPRPSTKQELARLVPMALAAVALGVTAEMLVAVRPVEPVEPPIPVLDEGALSRVADADRAAASRLEGAPPPVEIRAIGSAYLAWNEAAAAAPAQGDDPADPHHAELGGELRSAVAIARAKLGEESARQRLVDLRADHTERYLCTMRRVRRLGVDPFCRALLASHPVADDDAELRRLSGAFDDVLVHNGWVNASGAPRVPEAILRARYALHWTSIVFALDDCDRTTPQACYGLTSLPLPADELRALLGFLVAHPVVRPSDLAAAENNALGAADRRRLVYLRRLEALDTFADPKRETHPYVHDFALDLSRGALLYRLGDYANAAESFRVVARERPEDFRARNWLLATLQKLQP